MGISPSTNLYIYIAFIIIYIYRQIYSFRVFMCRLNVSQTSFDNPHSAINWITHKDIHLLRHNLKNRNMLHLLIILQCNEKENIRSQNHLSSCGLI